MRALLFLLLSAWCLLCGAAPVPVILAPPAPRLGVPLRVTLETGPGGGVLSGIPPLGPFALLAPPLEAQGRIHLDLLPLRPGSQTLPPFSLRRGPSGHLSSAPLAIEVAEGIAPDAATAPLKGWPKEVDGSKGLLPEILTLLLLGAFPAALLIGRLRKSPPSAPPPPPEALTGEDLLTELQRRLEALPPGEDPRRRGFSRRLTEARFAPAVPPETPARLLAEFRALWGEE